MSCNIIFVHQMNVVDGWQLVSRLLMILGTYLNLDLKNNVPVAFSQSYGGYYIRPYVYVVQIEVYRTRTPKNRK